jgi:predicted transcriptional regulator
MQTRLELQRWRETQAAIDAADRGEVVTKDEIFAWLDTWGREGITAKKPQSKPLSLGRGFSIRFT